MPPTSINNLPVELHTSILRHLFSLSRNPWFPCIFQIPAPVEFEWIEKDTQSASLFPFNVALVSKLWCDILALMPECWTRVVFDLSKDPTPFLDAFLWSGHLKNIEVFVFNSDDDKIVDETLEQSHVSAIAKALYPHIHRCKCIIFDVTYVTSLPPPMMFFIHDAPYLEKLALDCHIENPNLLLEMHLRRRQDFSTSFPALQELSLTGFGFMHLVLHARQSDWLKQLSARPVERHLSLSISHFAFPRHGRYSLPKFASYISGTTISSMHFHDLSLAYAYDGSETEPDFVYEIKVNSHFHSVSKDFLVHFYTIVDIPYGELLSFEACEIPEFKTNQSSDFLTLTNIIDNDESTSLRHILKVWTGLEVRIRSCPSFNDTLLSWLALGKEHTLSSQVPDINSNPQVWQSFVPLFAEGMSELVIIDCDNFTSRALRELVCLRNESILARYQGQINIYDVDSVINDLHVSGRGPELLDEDKRWFEQNQQNTTVYWAVGKAREFRLWRTDL